MTKKPTAKTDKRVNNGKTITQVNQEDRTIVAGCHTIDFEQIEKVMKSLYASEVA